MVLIEIEFLIAILNGSDFYSGRMINPENVYFSSKEKIALLTLSKLILLTSSGSYKVIHISSVASGAQFSGFVIPYRATIFSVMPQLNDRYHHHLRQLMSYYSMKLKIH